jgi:hypothetical protein
MKSVAIELDDEPVRPPQEVRFEPADPDIRLRRWQTGVAEQPQHALLSLGAAERSCGVVRQDLR